MVQAFHFQGSGTVLMMPGSTCYQTPCLLGHLVGTARNSKLLPSPGEFRTGSQTSARRRRSTKKSLQALFVLQTFLISLMRDPVLTFYAHHTTHA